MNTIHLVSFAFPSEYVSDQIRLLVVFENFVIMNCHSSLIERDAFSNDDLLDRVKVNFTDVCSQQGARVNYSPT